MLGLGYILNQNRPVKGNPIKQVNNNELPSATNVYDSKYVDTARKIEAELAKKKFAGITGPPLQPGMPSKIIPRTKVVTSDLSGMSLPENEFKHNNMTPFYRGKLKHMRLDGGGIANQLEAFTGAQQFYQPKREIENLFKPERNLGNVHGMQANAQYMQGRVDAPKVRNNVLPFEQVRVGPGLNRGFTAEPTGGFQQFDARDYAVPRNTDEVRTANKPKVTYEGRIVDGQKGSLLGKVGKVEKNRVATFFENTPARYFRTTGAYLKEKLQPTVDAKYTPRQDTTTRAYAGGAYKKSVGDAKRGEVREPFKEQLAAPGVTNATLTHIPNQKQDDYGKGGILIYDNERKITQTRTYQGNVTSIIKSFTAPLEDLIKVSRKEYTVEAPREYGSMQASFPAKQTVYDPNQVTRTTLKETIIHDSDLLNLRGHAKLMVYDPNQVMRTTIKETLLHDAQPQNLKGDRKQVQARPDIKAKTTVRETVEPIDTSRNIGGSRRGHTTHNPNVPARTTVKETNDVDAHRDFGNADRGENFKGGYQEENYEAPDTQRHVLAQENYQANPARTAGDAYQVVEDTFVPHETQKEGITEQSEYYGTAGDRTTHKQMSYDDAYNEVFDSLKEELLEGREPTQNSVKFANGAEDIILHTRKLECDAESQRLMNNADHITNVPLDADTAVTLTRNRNEYDIDDRLDVDILEAFNKNEFTQPLNSVA